MPLTFALHVLLVCYEAYIANSKCECRQMMANIERVESEKLEH
jgi:hypothetical protein